MLRPSGQAGSVAVAVLMMVWACPVAAAVGVEVAPVVESGELSETVRVAVQLLQDEQADAAWELLLPRLRDLDGWSAEQLSVEAGVVYVLAASARFKQGSISEAQARLAVGIEILDVHDAQAAGFWAVQFHGHLLRHLQRYEEARAALQSLRERLSRLEASGRLLEVSQGPALAISTAHGGGQYLALGAPWTPTAMLTKILDWLVQLGRVKLLQDEGHFDAARQLLMETWASTPGLLEPVFRTLALDELANVELARGNFEAAEACLERLEATLAALQWQESRIEALQRRATLAADRTNLAAANEHLQLALRLARQHRLQRREVLVLRDSAYIHRFARLADVAKVQQEWLQLALRLGDWRQAAEARMEMAELEIERGQLGEALRRLKEVEGELVTGQAPELKADALNRISYVYLLLGQSDVGLQYRDRAIEAAREHGQLDEVPGLSVFALGLSALLQGRPERMRLVPGLSPDWAQVLSVWVEAFALLKETDDQRALQRLDDAVASIDAWPQPWMAFLSRFLRGNLLFRLGRTDEAVAELERFVGDLVGAPPYVQPLVLPFVQGLSSYMREDDVAVDAYLQQARTALLDLRDQAGGAQIMQGFQGAASETLYSMLTMWALQTGEIQQAFRWTEQARAQVFQRQFGREHIDVRAGSAVDLLRQEQSLQARRRNLERQLRPPRSTDGPSEAVLQKRLREINIEYQRLLLEFEEEHAEAASLVRLEGSELSDIQTLLDPEEALISYLLLGDAILAWLVTREGYKVESWPMARDELRRRLSRFRDGITARDFDADEAQVLYRDLLEPLESQLPGKRLILVPHGELHSLPFAALQHPSSGRFLIEDHALSQVPAAGLLSFLEAKRSPFEGRALVLANADGSLPYAAEEARTVAALYDTEPLLGCAAREAVVRAHAGCVDLLHLAVHGRHQGRHAVFNRLELAGGACLPDEVESEDDGWLEVHEITGLDLSGTDLVVLSACQSGLGEHLPGDEIVGLARAFLYAGSPAVVTTLWSIDDEASGALMESFHRMLWRFPSFADALRRAQLSVLAQPRWRQPYYWAAYQLHGQGRGAL